MCFKWMRILSNSITKMMACAMSEGITCPFLLGQENEALKVIQVTLHSICGARVRNSGEVLRGHAEDFFSGVLTKARDAASSTAF